MKQYRLKKEYITPFPSSTKISRGEVLNESGAVYYFQNFNQIKFSKQTVECSPDWFAEIKVDTNDPDYGIKVLAWNLVNKINDEGMPTDLWKRRKFFINYFKEEIPLLKTVGLYFEYDGSMPDEVRFDHKTYVLKEKAKWSDDNMIEFASMVRSMTVAPTTSSLYEGYKDLQDKYKDLLKCL